MALPSTKLVAIAFFTRATGPWPTTLCVKDNFVGGIMLQIENNLIGHLIGHRAGNNTQHGYVKYNTMTGHWVPKDIGGLDQNVGQKLGLLVQLKGGRHCQNTK
jgi:hypothetical protein